MMTPSQTQQLKALMCEGCKEGAPVLYGEHVYRSEGMFPGTKKCTFNHAVTEWVERQLEAAHTEADMVRAHLAKEWYTAGERDMLERAARWFIQERLNWQKESGIPADFGAEEGCSCYGSDKSNSHASGCARNIAAKIRALPASENGPKEGKWMSNFHTLNSRWCAMSEILELQHKLQDTSATIAQLEQAIAANPTSDILRLNLESLSKRFDILDAEFKTLAARRAK